MELTQPQRVQLYNALKAMCMTKDNVDDLTFGTCGQSVDEITADGGVPALLRAVIAEVERRQKGVEDLINAAIQVLEAKPGAQKLPLNHPLKQLLIELSDSIYTEREDPFTARKLLGDRVLLDRQALRSSLRALCQDQSGKRILVVQGQRKSGRSHSGQLIRLLQHRLGSFEVIWADLDELVKAYVPDRADKLGPEHLGKTIAAQMGPIEVPARRQGESDAEWAISFCDWLTPFVQSTEKEYWIVLDSFDKQLLPQGIYDLVGNIALRIERQWPRLRLVLLSYDETKLPGQVRGGGLEVENLAGKIGKVELAGFFNLVYNERKQRRNVDYAPEDVVNSVRRVVEVVNPDSEEYLKELSQKALEEIRAIESGGGGT